MGLERSVDVPVYDLSLIRGIWEGRVKRYRQKEQKEQERREKSALARYGSCQVSPVTAASDAPVCAAAGSSCSGSIASTAKA